MAYSGKDKSSKIQQISQKEISSAIAEHEANTKRPNDASLPKKVSPQDKPTVSAQKSGGKSFRLGDAPGAEKLLGSVLPSK